MARACRCLEDHCPDSAHDWDAGATEASCKAEVHNLAGFVTRKKPTPDYAKARQYYDEALGFEPAHCPTLEYLTELNLQVGNSSGALATAETLCTSCGKDSPLAVQARAAFDAAATDAPGACKRDEGASSDDLTPLIAGATVGGIAALLAAICLYCYCCSSDPASSVAASSARTPHPTHAKAKSFVSPDLPHVGRTPASLPPSPPASLEREAPYVV